MPRSHRDTQRHRALIVSRIYHPEPAAASFRLRAIEQEFVSRGWDVHVLTTRTNFDAGAVGSAKAPRAAAPAGPPGAGGDADANQSEPSATHSRWPAIRDSSGYVRGYIPYLSFDLPVFFRILTAGHFDAIVVEPPPTTGMAVRVAAMLRRRPYFYLVPDLWSEAVAEVGVPSLVKRLLQQLERGAISGAQVALTVMPELAAKIRALAPRATISVMGYGVDLADFQPASESHGEVPGGPGLAAATATTHPYLVYAGTASEVHGAIIFIEAMAAVLQQRPDARLVVIGQGEERAAMEAAASSLGGAVSFYGRMDPRTTAAWLRGSRASLASVRPGPYGFAIATKIYAAAACGVPVIYAGEGAGPQLVREHALGEAVPYELQPVIDAMIRALDGQSPAAAPHQLVEWARENGSIQAVGRRVVDAVTEVVP